jgi:hypothetical protein
MYRRTWLWRGSTTWNSRSAPWGDRTKTSRYPSQSGLETGIWKGEDEKDSRCTHSGPGGFGQIKRKFFRFYSRFPSYSANPHLFPSKFKVEVVFSKQKRTSSNVKPGRNICLDDLKYARSGLCHRSFPVIDVTFLLIDTKIKDQFLLGNARWHSILKRDLDKDETLKLYQDLRSCLPSGYESNRRNSSGPTKLNTNTLNFFRYHGSLPRKVGGVHFIQQETSWVAIYISPFGPERKAVVYKGYTQPVRGGNFVLPPTVMKRNPFMFDFMKAKILTALVGRSLENILGIGISTNSISETIWQLREASELITKRNQVVENKIAGVELEHAILAMVGAYNRCSLVEYPTAYHVDRFAKTNLEEFLKSYAIPGVRWKLSSDTEAKFRKMLNAIEEGRERDACVVAVPSLENKKLLEIPMPSRIGLRGIGRGGKGKGRYVVAVLDWRNGPQALRRQQYLAAGGTAERVTQAVFDAFFGV